MLSTSSELISIFEEIEDLYVLADVTHSLRPILAFRKEMPDVVRRNPSNRFSNGGIINLNGARSHHSGGSVLKITVWITGKGDGMPTLRFLSSPAGLR
jgi:hypothetical protein